ncbi:MAG TPA: DNA alkylation repair protein [Polyangiaceae bacterium]|nr:DNA alkylation repair protein [Polyangiaceae bacterium]
MKRENSPALTRAIRNALRALAEPERAPAMQAYMKSAMPYLGVSAPRVKAACREVYASYPFESAELWRADVLSLWRGAKYREERYAAIALSGQRKAAAFQNLAALPMYEEMIVTGAWWDFTDELAEHRIGPLLAAYPRSMRKTMLVWSRSPDLWKRRTSIICQMFFREATDLELLFSCIEPSRSSQEFFLRKAIGWALRQLAKHDPQTVLRYVKEHQAELSPLTHREALKHLSSRSGRGSSATALQKRRP